MWRRCTTATTGCGGTAGAGVVWVPISVVMVLILVAMVTAIVFGIRYLMASQQVSPQPAANIADNSESLLTERFARGGIDETNIAVVWPFYASTVDHHWPTDINPPSSTSHRYGGTFMRIELRTAVAATVLGVVLASCSAVSDAPQPSPPTPATESARFGGSVWVAEEGDNSLTVLDAARNVVATTLTGLAGPHNVQIGHDGHTVYATSSANMVVAIDTKTYQVAAAAATGPSPAHVIEARNKKIYVTNSGDGTVSVYQGADLQQIGRIDVGGTPHGLRSAADGSVIVIADPVTGTVELIDPGTDQVTGSIAVGSGPAQVAVSSDGRYAYTGTTEPPAVVKVDLTSRTVVGSVAVPTAPVQLYLTPDESTVISADQGTREAAGHTVSLIDTTAMTLLRAVSTGAGPHGVVIDPTGTHAWVTNSYDDTVSVIDIPTQSVMATIPVGMGPNGISYSPRPPAPSGAAIALNIPALPATSADDPQPPSNHHGHG